MLRSLEKDRITRALEMVGFRAEAGSFMGAAYMYKLLSSVDYNIRITVSSYDSITAIVDRIADAAWRGRSLTRANRREVYRLSERVNRTYEQEAFRDPTGGSNINK